MAHETFDYDFFVQARPEQVFAHLAEPANYVGLSPLVTSVSDVQKTVDLQGLTIFRYVSIEEFRFLGFIHYPNRLHVTMTLRPNQQIISDVISPFWVNVRFVVDLRAEQGGTQVHETVTAKMPEIVHNFVVSEAKRVQVERAKTLKLRLEGV